MNRWLVIVFSFITVAAFTPSAQALDLEAVGLIGTGFDTGDAENNPYALQLGGALDLTVAGIVVGVRATRSIASDSDCTNCIDVRGLRSLGLDLGLDWELSMLHISPRFGFGHLRETDGAFDAAYFEPGGVGELEIGLLVIGVDVRYRLVAKHDEADGLLGFLRAGLRF